MSPDAAPASLTAWHCRSMAKDLHADGIDPTTVEIVADAPILWSSGTGGVSHAVLMRLAEDMSRSPAINIKHSA